MGIVEACQILGLSPDTYTVSELKRVYRQAALQWHPDRFPGDQQAQGEATKRFQRIQAAFDVLLRGWKPRRPRAARPEASEPAPKPRRPPRRMWRNPFASGAPDLEPDFPFNMGVWIYRVVKVYMAASFTFWLAFTITLNALGYEAPRSLFDPVELAKPALPDATDGGGTRGPATIIVR